MARSLVLGNGGLLVCLDQFAQVKNIYYHYVGLEDHLLGNAHKIGLFWDGKIHWLDDGTWQIKIESTTDTLIGHTTALSRDKKIKVEIFDAVYNEKSIFLRKFKITNLTGETKELSLFLSQEFQAYGNPVGNTSFFDSTCDAIVHYKGRRVFLINGLLDNKPFDDWTTGIAHFEGKEGSFADAEDGILAKNPIEHGPTDSAIGFHLSLPAGKQKVIYYWIAVGKDLKEARLLNRYVLTKTPAHLFKTTDYFWKAWVNKQAINFYDLPKPIVNLFKKSLMIIRTHVDNAGSILASGDSDILQGGKDTYAYMWPRDAAFTTIVLAKAGYHDLAEKFFSFCNEVITDEGYMMHKYLPDRSLGSSWHPWIENGKPTLPIQEDETALVLWALKTYYLAGKDIEFIETTYNSLIKKAADFLVEFRLANGLPKPSWDLWEEKFCISTFTASAVFGGLLSGCFFASLLGKTYEAAKYRAAAWEIKKAILSELYDEKNQSFIKGIVQKNGSLERDESCDLSSLYGLVEFGVLPVGDPRITQFIEVIRGKLAIKSSIGGFARHDNDPYWRIDEREPGNPWILTTLWFAQVLLARATKKADLGEVKKIFNWVVGLALPTGILPEQINPHTGEHVSVSPLTWSHAEFVNAVFCYLDKFKDLGLDRKYKIVKSPPEPIEGCTV